MTKRYLEDELRRAKAEAEKHELARWKAEDRTRLAEIRYAEVRKEVDVLKDELRALKAELADRNIENMALTEFIASAMRRFGEGMADMIGGTEG